MLLKSVWDEVGEISHGIPNILGIPELKIKNLEIFVHSASMGGLAALVSVRNALAKPSQFCIPCRPQLPV